MRENEGKWELWGKMTKIGKKGENWEKGDGKKIGTNETKLAPFSRGKRE